MAKSKLTQFRVNFMRIRVENYSILVDDVTGFAAQNQISENREEIFKHFEPVAVSDQISFGKLVKE